MNVVEAPGLRAIAFAINLLDAELAEVVVSRFLALGGRRSAQQHGNRVGTDSVFADTEGRLGLADGSHARLLRQTNDPLTRQCFQFTGRKAELA